MANLVLRKGFLNNPGNVQLFKEYLDYLLEKAQEKNDDRFDYLEDAFNAIMTFSENVELDKIDLVDQYLNRANSLKEELNEEYAREIRSKNEEVLDELNSKLKLLKKDQVTDESKIKNLLEEATELENNLKPGYFDSEQEERYQSLQKEFEEVAELKGEVLNESKHRRYNRDVVKRLKKMFAEFKNDEKKYKKEKEDILDLIDSKYEISAINNQYLNNETLTYFNYIYNYIFGVISDDDKFRLTKCMTETPKDILS